MLVLVLPAFGLIKLLFRESRRPGGRADTERPNNLSSHHHVAGKCNPCVHRQIQHEWVVVLPRQAGAEDFGAEEHSEGFTDHIRALQVAGLDHRCAGNQITRQSTEPPALDDGSPGRVDDVALAGCHDRRGVGLKIGNLSFDGCWVKQVVLADQLGELPFGLFTRIRPVRRGPRAWGDRHNSHAGVRQGIQVIDASVRAAAIGEDDLQLRVRLVEDRINQILEVWKPVEHGNNHGYQRRHGS